MLAQGPLESPGAFQGPSAPSTARNQDQPCLEQEAGLRLPKVPQRPRGCPAHHRRWKLGEIFPSAPYQAHGLFFCSPMLCPWKFSVFPRVWSRARSLTREVKRGTGHKRDVLKVQGCPRVCTHQTLSVQCTND